MDVFNKMFEKMGLKRKSEDEYDDDDIEQQETYESPPPEINSTSRYNKVEQHSAKVLNFQAAVSTRDGAGGSHKIDILTIKPVTFADAQKVADCLRENRPVIINFENTNEDAIRRIIDFISGTTYALKGDIRQVGHKVCLCTPINVKVTTREEKKVTSDSFFKDKGK